MRRLPLVFLLAAIVAGAGSAQDAGRLEVLARVRLREIQKGAAVVGAYMGAGITVRVKHATDGFAAGETLIVLAGGKRLADVEGGIYDTAALYRFEGAYHLVVAEYTGGAHCCGQYHVFSRAAGASSWRLVGASGAENGGPMPAWDVIVAKSGGLYLREWDDRFDYFHACHACSLLINMGPLFSLIAPEGLVPANEEFRDEYARLAAAAGAEVAAEAKRRAKNAAAILGPVDAGGERPFTDDLGQLLVKRTIFLVRAGDGGKAWKAFAADVARYYRTADGAEILRAEIIELLRQ